MNKHYNIHPDRLTEQQVRGFLSSLSREYALATINEATIAINRYYQEKEIDYKFPTKSLRTAQKLPQALLSRAEVQDVRQALPKFYRLILDEIYENLTTPGEAVKAFVSRGYSENPVHINTLHGQIKKARGKAGLTKLATSTTIYQAGIIHYLQDTNDLRGAADKTGLSDKRILYYYKIAQSLATKKAPG